tara:strand:- start:182 stop:1327 length:1146 start_codon:yes stop_codon:yes gene_type:complete
MKINIVFGITLFFISSCSTLAFWSDDVEEETAEPVRLTKIQNQYPIEVEWKRSFNGENDLGSFVPSFYSDEMIAADPDGNLVSINPSTGKINWEIDLQRNLSAGTASGFGKIMVSDTNGFVIAIDSVTKEILWEKSVGGEILANVVISPSLIIVKNSAGELVALDSLTGEQKWSFRSQLPALTVRGTGEPIIENNIIYSTFDNGRIGAFDLDTGYFLWDGPISFVEGTSELENLIDSDSSPVIAQQLIFATNYQGRLTAFDLAQKRPVWNAEASSFHSPVIGNNMLMVIQDDGSILSFSMTNLSPSWSSEEYLRRELSNGSMQNNLMLVGDLEGYIHVINTLTGITVGRRKVSGNPIARIVSFRNLAYVVDQKSNIVAVSF